eukprot:gene15607-biopygen8387
MVGARGSAARCLRAAACCSRTGKHGAPAQGRESTPAAAAKRRRRRAGAPPPPPEAAHPLAPDVDVRDRGVRDGEEPVRRRRLARAEAQLEEVGRGCGRPRTRWKIARNMGAGLHKCPEPSVLHGFGGGNVRHQA